MSSGSTNLLDASVSLAGFGWDSLIEVISAHALIHITWADSAAALVLVPILFRAAVLTFRGEHCCAHH